MKSILVSMIAAAGIMVAGSALATDMPKIAKKNGCTSCHKIDKKVVGPAWHDVAVKYKGATEYEYKGKKYPLVEGLMMKVSHGGKGNWGSMAMPANDAHEKKQEKIKELVHFVLGLAK
ncbi:MAG: cytochrome C [Gallionellaceae bacterium]